MEFFSGIRPSNDWLRQLWTFEDLEEAKLRANFAAIMTTLVAQTNELETINNVLSDFHEGRTPENLFLDENQIRLQIRNGFSRIQQHRVKIVSAHSFIDFINDAALQQDFRSKVEEAAQEFDEAVARFNHWRGVSGFLVLDPLYISENPPEVPLEVPSQEPPVKPSDNQSPENKQLSRQKSSENKHVKPPRDPSGPGNFVEPPSDEDEDNKDEEPSLKKP